MWQHVGPVEVELVVDDDILAQHCHILHAHLPQRGPITPALAQGSVPSSCSYPSIPSAAARGGGRARAEPQFPCEGTHILTHCPTEQLQPTMQDSSQEWERMRAPFSTVQRLMRTPSSTTTPAPIVTLGPMTQFAPILALGSWKEEGLRQVREGSQSSRCGPHHSASAGTGGHSLRMAARTAVGGRREPVTHAQGQHAGGWHLPPAHYPRHQAPNAASRGAEPAAPAGTCTCP